ncbi:MAG: polysaccharide biosynthesis tyrosine autokinase [Bacteroidales bacterium]|nr:polysaccharide biosynthesis tyrosine autokinase [Bacteroidales bacterium]
MSTSQKTAERSEEPLSVKDFLFICLSKWHWFVISLIITLVVAVFYILRTQPLYTRASQVMIKSDSKGSSISGAMGDFSDIGIFATSSSVDNEIIAIQSPSVMAEVVRRLQLDMNYAMDGAFHKKTIYGKSLPVNVRLMDVDENAYVSLALNILADGTVSLGNFVWYVDGNKNESDDAVSGKMFEAIETPLGKVVVTPTLNFVGGEEKVIHITRNGFHATTDEYSDRLQVALNNKKADVINLTITDVSPQRATDVLNKVIEVYNEKWIDDKNKITVSTSKFIEERLDSIVKELGDVDENISSYKSEQLLPDVTSVSSLYMAQSSKAAEELLELNNKIYMARYILDYLKDEKNNDKLLPANSGISASGIEEQIAEYNALQLRRSRLVSGHDIKNPVIDDIDKSLASMRIAIAASVENQIVALETQLDNMKRHEKKATEHIATNPKQEKYLRSVGRQQQVKEALYLYLLQKREENELSRAFTAYNTRIITPPTGSLTPTAPVKLKIILVAFLLGLTVPMIVIFMQENLITTIRGRRDIEKLTLPLIGEIPMTLPRRKWWMFGQKHRKLKSPFVVEDCNRNVINEAFRVLRTNIEFITKERGENVFILTSFNPGSGKSFLGANIAKSLTLKGRKVLLIDGDLRHASTSLLVNSPKQGIADYLAGRTNDIRELLRQPAGHENLYVLPVGTIPPNPTELLDSERFGKCVEELRTQYDYVLIDCPPIDIVSDTQIIEKYADRTIFVIRAGVLEKSMLPELEDIYKRKRFKNMSLILNATTDGGGGRYGNRYGYRYGYRYGSHSYVYGSDKK